ncbi:hypothetical protein BT93_H3714 [Corymbia citriodora subsp. variegata]|nr:hypothetical protein BT93_H3714 [Corymbia citriodora subsp. variegata]
MSYFQSPLHPHILFLRNLSQHLQNYSQLFYKGEKSFVAAPPPPSPPPPNICPCPPSLPPLPKNELLPKSLASSHPVPTKFEPTLPNLLLHFTSIYCCEKCEFCIHTSCATLPPPRQIQHPRHQHPLDLQLLNDKRNKGLYYRCVEFDHGCDFKLDIDTAMKTLQVEKYYCSVLREHSDGESRLQFAHEHPLTSFPVRRKTSCRVCQMQISEEEEAYGCSECRFFLHEACAKAPLEIQHHPFHPKHPLFLFYASSGVAKCSACYPGRCTAITTAQGIRYRCEECELIFHLSCVISTMPCEDDDDDDDDEREDIRRRPSAIDHPLHPHPLSSYHSKAQTELCCQNCRHGITSGDFYGCSDCFFFLDESCARPPADAIQHYLHPEHALTFTKHANENELNCSICGRLARRDSYCYTCEMCDFFIDPICANTTLSDLEEGGVMTAKYAFHEHELKLYYPIGHWDECEFCAGIMEEGTLAYRCFSRRCWFRIHKSCSQQPSELEHPSHSLHPLTFCFPPPDENIRCRGCYQRISGEPILGVPISGTFAFSCKECNFYLDAPCAKKPTLKHPFHEHHLFYIKGKSYGKRDRKCRACCKSCELDFFSCEHCDFRLHYECSQLPLTIKSEHHIDPLVLRESYVEEIYTRHYCDICEKRRDPNKWVYFCETNNCELVAHVECALSPVNDLIRQKEEIEKQEEEIRVAQEQVEAKEASLRPLMAELESMRANIELQRVELKELKRERAKWINTVVIKEDEFSSEEEPDSGFVNVAYSSD